MRGATLFSGGGGAEALLRSHINFVHAVEYDAHIAAVYAANIGPHVQVARVEDVDYSLWGALDYLHASPVCKEYSAAKTNGAEGEGDLSSAAAVVRCLEATQPRVFTLENVGAYQHGQAFRLIVQWLNHNGYMWHAEVLNAADFGVPQTRRRLILRAVRDALLPTLPPPVKWVGWYAAIEDLIPTLPESAFAPWQLARLEAAHDKGQVISGSLFVGGANKSQSFLDFAIENRPSIPGIRTADDPMMLVPADAATNQAGRAFIVDGDGNRSREPTVLDEARPSMTIQAWHGRRPVCMPRAFLMRDDNAGQEWGKQYRAQHEPAYSQSGSSGDRAWLTTGRVVKMTPRALARFQSFPDWYVLPEKSALACTVIGNAAPSLMMCEIVSQLI